MNLVEISKREVIEAAKVWRKMISFGYAWSGTQIPEARSLFDAVSLLESREALPTGAADTDPISACCAGNTGGAQHEGCVYPGCRCPCHREALPESLSDESDSSKLTEYRMPSPRPGAAPIDECEVIEDPPYTPAEQRGFTTRFPPQSAPIYRRKLSRRAQEIEKRRAADPLGADREDIDYSSDDLPSAR